MVFDVTPELHLRFGNNRSPRGKVKGINWMDHNLNIEKVTGTLGVCTMALA